MRTPNRSLTFLLLLGALLLGPSVAANPQIFGTAPTAAPPEGPALEPGEGLAIALTEGGGVQVYGEGRREGPMGSLAKLIWMQLEEAEWASRMLTFKCVAKPGAEPCGPPKGHGRVDFTKALRLDCHHAFQAWVQLSASIWKDIYGPGGARTRLDEAFGPFLDKRLPPGNELPQLTAPWIGQGELLRTSPEAFAKWLADPAQEILLDHAKRNLNSFFSDSPWWFFAGTAPVPGRAGVESAWAAGSDGVRVFVLALPAGKSRTEAMARVKALLGPAKS